ncbi:vesicle coat complex protein sec21 gamma subunit [Vairimorpha ceranae]|uniref:Vesicle coat complex protein sec21 gamma subunit n=1 Tax=Vairimorpha ceranae TaxID=40302 RepID=A0A0F9WRA6_9MICR|nr:vesicle coat complex protein sec21 gamma subunit [Vairimorpha ceranae]KAF5140366.1 hypothetical protein G9O61_00g014740 [Vairimorpha ceranae]KKO75448.1 vesicle coat complex protein sec21 gamma subunit [Vairimorpha ceranae]
MHNFFIKNSENAILQDISEKFNGTSLITRNCIKSINSFLYFLNTKEMNKDTLNSILILLLKSFQSKELYLKQVVYSTLVEVSKYTDQGFIGINIIVKDYSQSKIKHKIIKSLFCIIPEEMINDFTKMLKEAFLSNDQNLINSAVIVCLFLLDKNCSKVKDLFKTLNITDDIYGYHSLNLLNLSNKILGNNDKGSLRNIFSHKNEAGILSVRLATKFKKFELFKNFLNLRISDTYVFFEACKQMSMIKEEYSISYISMICQGLRSFLKNGNFYEKFASIKILSKLSTSFPRKIEILNKEIEELLQDTSKSLSMLAISTLLKTGTEETIDRLVKYLPEFMAEMDDNYKIVGLNALYILTTKNSRKLDIFLDFTRKCFLEKGNLNFKLFIVNLLKKLTKNIELLDTVLDIYVCYLEDSEYHEVSSEILGIMSHEIYKSKNSKKYLLHVYNRLILEDEKIKSAALQCIYNLSDKMEISESIFEDNEDEIINTFYINNLKNNIHSAEDFEMSSLGDLQPKVETYLKSFTFVDNDEKKVVHQVKECRELYLSKENDEINVKLVKKITENKIVLEYTIENKYEDIEIKNGVLGVKIKNKITPLPFNHLKPSQSITLELDIDSEPDLTVYGTLDYEICMVDDYSEAESESMSLLPYQITIFDLMKNIEKEKGQYSGSIKITLKTDLAGGSKKILDLINLKIYSQNNFNNCNHLQFCGEYNNLGCFIDCTIEFDKVCRCNIEIWNDSDELLERLLKYFE